MATPNHIILIPLTLDQCAIIDPIDGELAHVLWFAQTKPSGDFYAVRNVRINTKGTLHLLHRYVMARKLGRDLIPGELVDHIDGNGLNCRRSNLRLASQQQNTYNQGKRRHNTTGYKGVYMDKKTGKYKSKIRGKGIIQYLGTFDTAAEAHAAYCTAAKELHGEFMRTE